MYKFKVLLIALAVLLVTAATTGSAHALSTRKIYAAVGDSVAAGLGLAPKANPVGNDTRCGRSVQAYAYTVAKNANLPLVFLPCSGATAGDLITKQDVNGVEVPAQLPRAYQYGTPSLITITAGSNDVHWRSFIEACFVVNCDTKAFTDAATAYRDVYKAKLNADFLYIAGRSGNAPHVIITGYYNPTSASCAKTQSRVTAAELSWISNETAALNTAIRVTASHYSFVTYAPVSFAGHDLCSATPWVQSLSAAAPLHPTAAGQKAIAKSVISKLSTSTD